MKIKPDMKLPIRKGNGNILYFPPHARFPNGAPNAKRNWNIDITKKIITHETAAVSIID